MLNYKSWTSLYHWLTYPSFIDHLNNDVDHGVSANSKIPKMFQEARGDVRLDVED